MPLYEYECRTCGKRFEQIRRVAEADVAACPFCSGADVTKLLSPPAIQFKGTGWYVTDYAGKGSAQEEKKEDKKADVSVDEGVKKVANSD